MADQELTCIDCKNPFFFTDGEQAFYAKQGYAPPKRCKSCRDKKKRQKEQEDQQQKVYQQVKTTPASPEDDHRKKDKGPRRGGQKGHW